MNNKNIQTIGSYHPDDGYIFTICFSGTHTVTLDGLTREDVEHMKSCLECMLFTEEI